MKLIEKIKFLLRLAERYSQDFDSICNFMQENRRIINERTEVHCDIHHKQPSQVIVIGKYRNRDYVRRFTVQHNTLDELIEILKVEEKNAKVGRMDMLVHSLPFSAVYPRERF